MQLSWSRLYWEDQKLQSLPTSADIDADPPKGVRVRVDLIREEYLDCVGFWPNLPFESETMNEEEFYQFSNLVESNEDYQDDDIPEGYIPILFRKNPTEWFKRVQQENANAGRFNQTFPDAFKLYGVDEKQISTSTNKDDKAKPKSSIKPVLNICAMCFKGPRATFNMCEDVNSDYFLDSDLLKCSNCCQAYFCSIPCQKKAWNLHKISCKGNEGKIACIQMKSPTEMKQVYLDPNDPAFDQATLSPIMARCHIPLCLLPIKPGQNNYWCTYLMIDPVTGFAPMQWSDLGPVLICRRDRMPITKAHCLQLGVFISNIVSSFGGDNDENIHKTMMTREAFITFLVDGSSTNPANPGGVSCLTAL